MPELLKKLHDESNLIRFIELAGLLHDIGKLSKVFLEYRQKWQNLSNGWDVDPHEKQYLAKHEVFVHQIPPEFNNYTILASIDSGKKDFSIKKAVDFHTKASEDLILKLLKAADGLDSAIDRNNPLWGSEQNGNIYKSNVFGYENNRTVTVESQENARQTLYASLADMLPEYLKNFNSKSRMEILKEIRKAFDQGLADTTRPQNDTTLWDHSYAVASILKVLVVHYILKDEELDCIDKVKFGIFGIGWDGMRFLSYGQKIGDIIGRETVIKTLKEHLRELIEYKYPIGNVIYSDNDGIYFIVPRGFSDYEKSDELKPLRSKILDEVYSIAAKASSHELQPHITEIPETGTMTSLVAAIREMKSKVSSPFDSSVNAFDKHFKDCLIKFEHNKTICPICRLRPVEKKDGKKEICKICKDRRSQDNEDKPYKDKPISNETLFIDEIVDEHKRAAFIVARFGLDNWLNGKMVRTLFVTEANGIKREVENLGNVKQFEDYEIITKEFLTKQKYGEFNYNRIKADIDAIFKNRDHERAKHIAFLYDRRNEFPDKVNVGDIKQKWERLLHATQKENPKIDIYNMINAKTPTPSTLLDVWNTTLMFEDKSRNVLKSLLPKNKRLRLKIKQENGYRSRACDKGTFEAEVLGTASKKVDILYIEENIVEIIGELFSNRSELEWKDKKIKITDNNDEDSDNAIFTIENCLAGDSFIPCRTITATPNLFMAIVPADRALEITDLIYRQYIERFGKVMGRLPFSIGNIFFDRKMPMFVVLDAGRRMIENFDRLGNKEIPFIVSKTDKKDTEFDLQYTVDNNINKIITWRLPSKLGNRKDDFHHPYFIVSSNAKSPPDSRKSFFKTIGGDVVHFSDIEDKDTITIYPNYYDFEFLDSNTRRYDINLDTHNKRKSNVADFKSKPFLLDELDQKIMRLWSELLQGKQLKGITDTKLRNIQSLWLTKYQEWNVSNCAKRYKVWKDFIDCSIRKEFSISKDSEQYILLMETVNNGLFFDTLELYLGILKKRIETK